MTRALERERTWKFDGGCSVVEEPILEVQHQPKSLVTGYRLYILRPRCGHSSEMLFFPTAQGCRAAELYGVSSLLQIYIQTNLLLLTQ